MLATATCSGGRVGSSSSGGTALALGLALMVAGIDSGNLLSQIGECRSGVVVVLVLSASACGSRSRISSGRIVVTSLLLLLALVTSGC